MLIYKATLQTKKHAELKKENYKYECLCMHAHSIPLGYLYLKHQIYTSFSGAHHLHMSQNFLYNYIPQFSIYLIGTGLLS